jgi:alcohol oxidase
LWAALDPTLIPPGQLGKYYTTAIYTTYPWLRSSIYVNFMDVIIDGDRFDAGFLKHSSDIKIQLWAHKMFCEIACRLLYFKGELELGHPKFPIQVRQC